ncbi:uncharacterized protein LOC111023060 [Momordica charantia]|uniref:Uncharacterized protein LOC111023060 n=1 Tax=Momordica charantia TaxID=3673 RepID=A0A6J1DPN4_MOMCH|nr:uncharacterized protein LOC111023060 [Momordica charantia]
MEAMRTQMRTMEEMYNKMVQIAGARSRSGDQVVHEDVHEQGDLHCDPVDEEHLGGDLRDHLNRKRNSSHRGERTSTYWHKNSNQQAESSYNPIAPEGVITREEFNQLKSKFDAQVEALKVRCEKKESAFDDGDLGESPFTSDILEASIPPKFKTPTMKSYDGSKDPKDYVEVFEGLMDFQAATDAIKCRAFQIALTGSARLWYRRLPARSISTYSQLRKEFISQFFSRHYDRKTTTHLATIRQKEGKTLKEYITRFQEEQLKVVHCSDDSSMCYFLTGLADETPTVKLGEEALATFAEVLQMEKKFIDGQELLRTKTDRPEKQIDQKKSSQDKRKADSKSKDKGSSSSNSRTDYCRSNSVEKKEERKRSRTPPRLDDRPAVINTIFGGPSGGQSGNKRKELAREASREVCIIREQRPTCSVTFDDSDLEGVHLPYNDALVIAPLIDHVLVRRVLVDGGASANILSLALGWTRSQLKKSPTPLVGFSEESVSQKGILTCRLL